MKRPGPEGHHSPPYSTNVKMLSCILLFIYIHDVGLRETQRKLYFWTPFWLYCVEWSILNTLDRTICFRTISQNFPERRNKSTSNLSGPQAPICDGNLTILCTELLKMVVVVFKIRLATSFFRCNPMWFLSMGLRQGSGLCSSRKYPGTEGTNQNRHWNHHRWHATDSLEGTRLSCWCL